MNDIEQDPDRRRQIGREVSRLCEASYGCAGPVVVEEEVKRGILRKRIGKQTLETCGLPKDKQIIEVV